uniref:Transcription factor 24 n=1 Tax=Eptatretus burgeri TaxID=7764 RepID=A0A8C4QAU5_EPTBU
MLERECTDGPVAGSGDTDGVTASSASRVPDLGSGKGSSVPGLRPGRPAVANAARERSRVKTLRQAFQELQRTLPAVPPDTKLSKLDVLLLASTYIAHLTRTLRGDGDRAGSLRQRASYLHPVKVQYRRALDTEHTHTHR